MDEPALATRPIEDFIPRSLLNRRGELIIAETAGTLGRAKFCVHRRDEFHEAFIEPFLAAHENDPSPGRRLRVGYISADFRQHVVGMNLLPLLREHDRER